MTASISSPIGAEFTEAKAPVPALGVIGRVYPATSVALTAEFTGFSLPDSIKNRLGESVGESFDARLFDLDIYGTINFGRHVGVQLGYRSVDADYLVDEDIGTLTLKGMYFGGLVRF